MFYIQNIDSGLFVKSVKITRYGFSITYVKDEINSRKFVNFEPAQKLLDKINKNNEFKIIHGSFVKGIVTINK